MTAVQLEGLEYKIYEVFLTDQGQFVEKVHDLRLKYKWVVDQWQ